MEECGEIEQIKNGKKDMPIKCLISKVTVIVLQSCNIFPTQKEELYKKDAKSELIFESCVVKNSTKASLLLVSPKCTFGWAWGSKYLKFCMLQIAGKGIFLCILSYLARAISDN